MAAPTPTRSRRRWRLGRRGVASLEFVVAAPILLILMGGGFDLGMLLRVQMVMASGLTNAVQYAETVGGNTTAANLQSVMVNATGLNGLTATVAGPNRYCPSSYPVTLTVLVNATTCPGATRPANKYVVITASYNYVPVLPGLSGLVATTVVRTATAMVQ